MPKKADTPVYDPPTLFPLYRPVPLNLQQREEMRAFMAGKTFQQAIKNAYSKKPLTNAIGVGPWNEHSAQMSVNRLHQLQGWEMFEAAFFGQAEEKVTTTRKPIEEKYQEPGV